ncbi:MAG: hypothetical protein HOM21_03440, partial [Halobacteriovoraceae bacterium]|nr:hypothetical protein [Halobacteriovoraceae bacterium]
EIVRNKKNGFVPLIELRKDLYSAERSTRCKKIEKQVAGLCGILEKEVFFSAANLNQVEFNKQFAALGKGEYQDLKDEVESIYSGMNCMLPRLAGVVGIDEVDILISSRIGDFDSDLQGTSIPIPVIERKFREQVAKVQGLKELAERAEAAGTLTDEKREEIRTLVTGYKLPGGEPFIVPAGAKTITEQISAYEGAVAEWASRRVKGRVDEIEDEINEIARSNIPEKEKARKLDALIGEMKKLKDSGLSDRIAEKQREVRKFIDRYREDKDKVISELPIGDEKKNGTQGGSEAKERKVAGNVAGNNSQAKRGSSVRPGSNFRSNFGFSPPIDNSVNVSSGDQAVASTQKTQGAVLGRFIPREEFGDEKTRQELMVRYGELPIAVIDDKVSKFDIFSLQLENGVPTYVKKGSMSFEEAEKNGYFLTKDIRAVLEGYKEEKAGKGLESILNYMPDKSSLAKKISVLRKIQEFADAKEEMSGVRVAKTTLENLHRLLDNAIQN